MTENYLNDLSTLSRPDTFENPQQQKVIDSKRMSRTRKKIQNQK